MNEIYKQCRQCKKILESKFYETLESRICKQCQEERIKEFIKSE